MNKFFTIVYAENNRQFKSHLKKTKNSVLISYEDIISSQQKYSLFDEKPSYIVIQSELFNKTYKAINNMLTNKKTPCHFIYFYTNTLQYEILDNLIDNIKDKIDKTPTDINTEICMLSLAELEDYEEECLQKIIKNKNVKLLEKTISLKTS